jgi:hypothetical protein
MAIQKNLLQYMDYEDNGAFDEDLFDLYPSTPVAPLSQVTPVAPVAPTPVVQAPVVQSPISPPVSEQPPVSALSAIVRGRNSVLEDTTSISNDADTTQAPLQTAPSTTTSLPANAGALTQATNTVSAPNTLQTTVAEQNDADALLTALDANKATTPANQTTTAASQTTPAVTPATTAKAPSQDDINNVKTQILGQGLTGKWSGEGYGSAEANAEDMAKILAGIGITDIRQFGKVPQYEQAEVQYGINGNVARQDSEGNYYIMVPGGTDSEGNQMMSPQYIDQSQLKPIYGFRKTIDPEGNTAFEAVDSSKVITKNGVPVVQTGETFGNKVTGQAVPNTYSERQTGNFFGGTFTGKGNTGYGVQFDAQGNPYFYTAGASSNDLANIMKDLGPLGQVALAVATGGLSIPQQIAANLAMNVLSGKDLGDALKSAAISFAGAQIPGLDAMKGGAEFITNLGLSPELTSTLTNAFQNAAVSGAGALISGGNVGEAMMRGAVTGGANGAVNALMGNIAGFSDLTPAQQKMATNAVTGLISGKPLDQIVINSAIAAANAEVSKALGVSKKTTTDSTTTQGSTDDSISRELDKQLTFDGTGASDVNAAAATAEAQGYNKFTFGGKTYTLDNNNAANTVAQLEADALATNTANNLKGGEFEGVDAAVAANAASNNTVIGNAEADNVDEAAYLAKQRNPTGTTFTYGGQTYTMGASSDAVDRAFNEAKAEELRNNIANAPSRSEAYKLARQALGAGQTFTWNGQSYSTNTAEEDQAKANAKIDALNKANLSTVTDASKTVAAQSDTAARDTAAQELVKQQADAAKATESTGFFSNLAKSIQNQMKLSSEAANDYLKNNPNSPITNSVSTAYEAAGNLQKNAAGGLALLLDNKPLADAFVKSGDDLTKFGQSIGNGVVDTKNWNDTMSLLENAKGFDKIGVLAGRIMDGNSGLGRQVEVELRQELPGLFLGGGSVKGILIATGAMDVAETTGNAALDAYEAAAKRGLTHADALTEARKAGAAAGVAEAAIQLTLGKVADVVIGKVGSVAGKAGAKVLGEGFVEAGQEGTSSLAVNAALGQDLDVNKALTQSVVGGAVGKSTSATTSPVDVVTSQTITNNITTAATTGDASTVNSAITNSVQQSLNNGASVDTAVGTTVGAAITSGADTTSSITTAVTTAVTSGADTAQVVGSAVTSAVTAGADVTTTVTSAVQAAVTAGADVTTATTTATTAAVTASITSGADVTTTITSSVTAAVTAGADVTTATTTATTAAVTASITAGADVTTAVTTAVGAAVTAGGDVTTVSNAAVTSAVTTSVTSGADVTTTITNSVQAAVTAGADASTAATTATTAAVTASINAGADTTTAITTSVAAAVDAGATVTAATNAATTAAVTTSITAGVDTTTAITTAVDAAVTAGADVTTATNTAVTAAVTASVTAGADTTTAINSSVTAAVTSGADVTTAVTTAVTAAVDASVTQAVTNGTDVSTAITNSVTSSVSSAVTNDTSVTTAVETAVSTAISSAVTNNADVTAAVNSSVSSAITSAIEGNVDSSTAISTAVDSAVTTAIENNVDSSTAITTAVDSAITTAINADTSANVNTVVNNAVTSAVDAAVNSGVDVTTAVNTAIDAAVNANINTKANIDIPALVKAAVDSATKTAEIVELRASVNDLIAKASAPTATPDPTKTAKTTKPTTPAQSAGLNAGLLAGVVSAGELARLPPQMLKAYMTQDKFVDPLAKLQALQEDMNTEKMQPQVNTQDTEMPDQGTWKYGNAPDDIDSLFGEEEEEAAFKEGGFVAPLQMASGGAMALPLLAKSGGALGALPRPDGRMDFRHGAHVAGEGDGQSDDIKAMLADGEFVFPADVVSALGNGSTKAGSDKLYEMMHSIRARARSKKPKDLPPPALKSPLDYLKKKR